MQQKTRTMARAAVLAILATAILVAAAPRPTFASSPVDPNCLGKDLSSFTKVYPGFVGDIAKSLSSGGFDNEILAHKQGIPNVSSCPDYGFPTPLH